jgi:hypothetical protein
MQLVAVANEAAPSPTGSTPPNAAPLLDGSVIPSSQWLKSYVPNSTAAAPVNFRAPMPCPACYSSNFSIDLLLPSKVPSCCCLESAFSIVHCSQCCIQAVVGEPMDIAFVVTSCSDLLEDVEVEVEQLSPNFIVAGYFKVCHTSRSLHNIYA